MFKFTHLTTIIFVFVRGYTCAHGEPSLYVSPTRQNGQVEPGFVISEVTCTLYLQEEEFMNQEDEEKWICSDLHSATDSEVLKSVFFVEIQGDGFDVQSQINAAGVKSGASTMSISSIVLKPERSKMLIPSDATIRMEAVQNQINVRHLDGVASDRTGVMLRVIAAGKEPEASKEDLMSYTFEGKNGVISAAEQFRECSYGKMNMTGGILEIEVEEPISINKTTRETIINNAMGKFNEQYDVDEFSFVMVCIPGGTIRKDDSSPFWIAYAYIGGKYSFYNDNDDSCKSVSVKMHELGHNLGLHHSGAKNAQDDETGLMGPSRGLNFRKMCFNSAKNFQLGWYEDAAQSVDPLDPLSSSSQTYDLIGVADYGSYKNEDRSKLVVLELNTSGVNDFYVGYNRRAGINDGVRQYPNKIIITQREGKEVKGSKSKIREVLDFCQSYTISNYNSTGKDVRVKVIGMAKDTATIKVTDSSNEANGDNECLPQCNSGSTTVSVKIRTDGYPGDTEWHIKESSTEKVVAFQENYEIVRGDDIRTVTLCYGTNYKFTISDKFFDGLSNPLGEGKYTGFDEKGKVLFEGGEDFTGYRQSKEFTTPSNPDSSTKPPTVQPSKSPTKSPTVQPSKSPTKSPTVQPSPPLNCEDTAAPFWINKKKKTCGFVERNRKIHCNKIDDDGKQVSEHCPGRCKDECCVDKRGNIKRKVKGKKRVRCNNFDTKHGLKCGTKVKGKSKIMHYCRNKCSNTCQK